MILYVPEKPVGKRFSVAELSGGAAVSHGLQKKGGSKRKQHGLGVLLPMGIFDHHHFQEDPDAGIFGKLEMHGSFNSSKGCSSARQNSMDRRLIEVCRSENIFSPLISDILNCIIKTEGLPEKRGEYSTKEDVFMSIMASVFRCYSFLLSLIMGR